MKKTKLLFIISFLTNCFSFWIQYRIWLHPTGYPSLIKHQNKINLLEEELSMIKRKNEKIENLNRFLSEEIDLDTLKYYTRSVLDLLDSNAVIVIHLPDY